jgi:hypothetical protein
MRSKLLLSLSTEREIGESEDGSQGDQIGQIFAHWVLVYSWQVFIKKIKVARMFGLQFSTVKIIH